MGCSQHDTSPSVPFTTMISVSHFSPRKRVPAAVGMGRRLPNTPASPTIRAAEVVG
jgi:hypothetical protein